VSAQCAKEEASAPAAAAKKEAEAKRLADEDAK